MSTFAIKFDFDVFFLTYNMMVGDPLELDDELLIHAKAHRRRDVHLKRRKLYQNFLKIMKTSLCVMNML